MQQPKILINARSLGTLHSALQAQGVKGQLMLSWYERYSIKLKQTDTILLALHEGLQKRHLEEAKMRLNNPTHAVPPGWQ